MCVCVCTLNRIAKVAAFEDHHDGSVIKCVRFRPPGGAGPEAPAPPTTFASCGNDKASAARCTRLVPRPAHITGYGGPGISWRVRQDAPGRLIHARAGLARAG